MKPEFFGDNRQLFGLYQPPRGNPARPVRAVVICPPFGQDYIRSYWCLRLLAGQLARKGMHVLRFDYFGIGDSVGSPQDMQSLNHWETDVETAINHLLEISGAQSCHLVGLRTGASLAARVAQRRSDVNSLLLWEPVVSGSQWLNSMRKLHSAMLDLWVCKMKTANDRQNEELLGTLYSRNFIDELDTMLIDWNALQQPHLIVDLAEFRSQYDSHNNSMRKVVFTDDENSWSDLRQLETAWLRPQTTRLIVENIEDIFDRLIRFEVLSAPMENVR